MDTLNIGQLEIEVETWPFLWKVFAYHFFDGQKIYRWLIFCRITDDLISANKCIRCKFVLYIVQKVLLSNRFNHNFCYILQWPVSILHIDHQVVNYYDHIDLPILPIF